MDNNFLRYTCQLNLPGFGEQAQQCLANARVLVVGMGGLGCPVAQYLTASGIGTIGIVDDDIISVSNLHRQILYTEAESGQKKVTVAAQKLKAQNPNINIVEHRLRATPANVLDLIKDYDIVADCTDNFDARYLLNDACVLQGKPLVYGAIYQYEGQVAVWNVKNADGSFSPNYRDLFPEVDATQIPDCATGGVLPTLAGIIGCIQANEVIKYITQTGELLSGKLLMLDVQTMRSQIIKTGSVTNTNITSLPQATIIPTITKESLNDTYQLIDVRTAEEREAHNIGGTHIPLSELENNIDKITTEKPIVFYCATGKRSGEAVKLLQRKRADIKAFSLSGGLNG